MTDITTTKTDEQKAERIIEELRTATGQQVFLAFYDAPTSNLTNMAEMIEFILKRRKDADTCECTH